MNELYQHFPDSHEIPAYITDEYIPPKSKYAAIVCAKNEGDRLLVQLERMQQQALDSFDVVIADGPSTDGSTSPENMEEYGVTCVIKLIEGGGLSAALLAAMDYILRNGYEGLVMMDGNNKDSVESLLEFAHELDLGLDYVQGSRFIPGGQAENTPFSRLFLIRVIHAPYTSLICRKWFTDSTNGFRGISRKFLLSPQVNVFRSVFNDYELPYYLAWAACRFGFKVKEIPVTRSYPAEGPVPTKIVGVAGYWRMLKPMLMLLFSRY